MFGARTGARYMARYTGPKFKLSRREGVNLTGTASPRLEKVINVPPGGRRRQRPTRRVTGVPQHKDIEPDIREDLVVEFYAR